MLGARLMAATSGTVQIGVGVLYLAPETLVRRPLEPGQVSAVVYIESFGPIWTIGFALTGLLLLTAAFRKKGFVPGHIMSASWWGFYSGSILLSAVLTEPPAPVVAGAIAAGLGCALQLAIARSDAERGHR